MVGLPPLRARLGLVVMRIMFCINYSRIKWNSVAAWISSEGERVPAAAVKARGLKGKGAPTFSAPGVIGWA